MTTVAEQLTLFGPGPKPADKPVSKGAWLSIREALSRIPVSKYAVPSETVAHVLNDPKSNDLVFFEVRVYMGTTYMRQLHGAPGHFNRSKMTPAQQQALVNTIVHDPYKYARLFGEHHRCCARCGAQLTDQKSRERLLGPECVKYFPSVA